MSAKITNWNLYSSSLMLARPGARTIEYLHLYVWNYCIEHTPLVFITRRFHNNIIEVYGQSGLNNYHIYLCIIYEDLK